jgi:hypothetical protein
VDDEGSWVHIQGRRGVQHKSVGSDNCDGYGDVKGIRVPQLHFKRKYRESTI